MQKEYVVMPGGKGPGYQGGGRAVQLIGEPHGAVCRFFV